LTYEFFYTRNIINLNTKINVFIDMINEQVLTEKLKYLIKMNAAKWFDIQDIYVEFEYTDESREKLSRYDLDITLDYHGAIDLELSEFVRDVVKMSNELQKYLLEFVVNQEGKIVSGNNSNVYALDPLLFSADYRVDEKHKFVLGYKFLYEEN